MAVYDNDLQDLYRKFDGVEPGGSQRLAAYGQERAKGWSHEQAIALTYQRYKRWCDEFWPKRGIPLPDAPQD